MSSRLVLGISSYYHDSAACLVQDGEILSAVQEERFTRVKNDPSFPANAVRFCLEQAGKRLSELDEIIYYEDPHKKFDRLAESHMSSAPNGSTNFRKFLKSWLGGRIAVGELIRKQLQTQAAGTKLPNIRYVDHHHAHAASAYYPSGFEEAAVLCMDGVGEWATTSAWHAVGTDITPLWEIRFPHSLGLLYSAFTHHIGFEVNSGEYKMMGLAPYGEPRFVDQIRSNLIDIKEDGSFRLNMEYFDYVVGEKMTTAAFDRLFGSARLSSQELTQRDVDLARSIQVVTEEVVLRLARRLRAETGKRNLCLAGGVALNCVVNGLLLKEGIFDNIWIQPAAGDAGGAVGAALIGAPGKVGSESAGRDRMRGAFLGPAWTQEEVATFLTSVGARFSVFDEGELLSRAADLLANGKVIGWFQGRMEFGPRALGARSILADARPMDMQSRINQKVKFRESFRPFAPAVMKERVQDYFEYSLDNAYMQFVLPLRKERRQASKVAPSESFSDLSRQNLGNSDVPAITHVDYSARVQSVSPEWNPRFYKLIARFEEITGCSLVVNTSFNVNEEPIVCSPEDAYRCYLKTNIDALVIENCILEKSEGI